MKKDGLARRREEREGGEWMVKVDRRNVFFAPSRLRVKSELAEQEDE